MNKAAEEICKVIYALDRLMDLDYSDLGNEIGIILENNKDSNKLGYDVKDFYNGLAHGISLVDGTHDK